jgi:DNA adenine methylase
MGKLQEMSEKYLFDGWYGNKKVYLPIIEPIILHANRLVKTRVGAVSMNNFVDVFGGGGSVSFLSKFELSRHIYNDLDHHLINFFTVIKHKLDEFSDRLEYQLCDLEQLTEMHRKIRVNKYIDDVDKAICFYFIWQYSLLSKGIQSPVFMSNTTNRPKKVSVVILQAKQLYTRLEFFIIEHMDYKDLLTKYDAETSILFLDPPYDSDQSMYLDGKGGFNHEELKAILLDHKSKWILMYNDNEYIRELYKDYCINPVSRYSPVTKKEYHELIITNFKYKVKNELF